MGQILTSLNLRGGDASEPELDFDLKSVSCSEDEAPIYDILLELKEEGDELIQAIRDYKPAAEEIRNAIGNPTTANENQAWEAVLPIAVVLTKFYEYSNNFNNGMNKFLKALCEDDVKKNLEKYKASTIVFAKLLDLIFEIDYLKMENVGLQNGFSFYRRLLQRGRYAPASPSSTSDLRSVMAQEDTVNEISLFIASPTPILKGFIDQTSEFVKAQQLQEKVGKCLTILWRTCFAAVSKKESPRPDVSATCLKIIVISIILYDNIMVDGAFSKKSPIDIKHSVKIISSNNSKSKDPKMSNLIQALKYNSKHLNDSTTPKGVKNLVQAA